MNSIVCTLFEGHYHYGVAALVNSLYSNGYRGIVYVGYRGELPAWADKAVANAEVSWDGVRSLHVTDTLTIHFLPVTADMHLTNYKPLFALLLLKLFEDRVTGIYYFDPDIVVKCNWEFYETWIKHGVALVHEITNNDMPATHPVRKEWEKIICETGRKCNKQITSYINAGFFGLLKKHKDFLTAYIGYVEYSIQIHNADVSMLQFGIDRTDLFFAKDQDALNIAAMCCEAPISEYGPEAMDFIHGGKVMSHAVGSPKPWKKAFFSSALKGKSPTLADKQYWKNANGIISPYSGKQISSKLNIIKVASFIGRFYRKH